MRSLLLLALVFVLSCSASDCPSGAIYSANFNKCYLVMPTKNSFQLAEEYCSNIGGHLVSIRNAFENSYVAELAQNNCGGLCFRTYWIGATNQGTFNYTFVWTDGSPFSYTHWMSGMPEYSDYYNCVYMLPGTGDWVTNVCHGKNSFVCEFMPKNSTYH